MPDRRPRWQPPYVARSIPRALLEASRNTTDRALIGCLYYAGLRAGEACALRWDALDLDGEQPALTVSLHWSRDRRELQPGGKGGGTKTIPVSARLLGILREHKRSGAGPWVFPSPRHVGRPMKPITAWRTLKALARRAGLDPARIYPHLLRHATAEHQMEAGVPLDEVRDFLRHADIATTGIYLQTNQRRLRRAADALE